MRRTIGFNRIATVVVLMASVFFQVRTTYILLKNFARVRKFNEIPDERRPTIANYNIVINYDVRAAFALRSRDVKFRESEFYIILHYVTSFNRENEFYAERFYTCIYNRDL